MRFFLTSIISLLVATLVAASTFEEHKRRDGLQVWQSSRRGRDVMWGRCNGWFRKLKSCVLQETTCAAHLSPGPEDADIEVRLGNLPVFPEHPTFVQWWGARKSDEPYDPVANPEDAQVYDSMFKAYPRYFDPDFNGGNVQVDSNGEAVIRFRAPAAHRVDKHTRLPHVHLRICSAGQHFSIILGRKDKVQLTSDGPVAKSECNSEENKIHVLNFQRISKPHTKKQESLVQRGLDLAHRFVEQLDLDTLEFSPVFQCLSSGLYYDHFEGDCVDSCPEGSVIRLGQCVKPAVTSNSFSVMWDLQTCGCDERCWADKRNMTLHRLRLEIADHLDIPLQEVHDLDLSYMSNSKPGHASVARMHIRITSPRHTTEAGATMLRSLFHDMQRSSEVLTMLVLGVREVSVQDLGFLHKRLPPAHDPYETYYQDLNIVKASATEDMPVHKEVASPSHGDVNAPPASKPVPLAGNVVGLQAGAFFCVVVFCSLTALLTYTKYYKIKAREPPLRTLGQPLASAEDPPLFPGGARMSQCVLPKAQPVTAQQSSVARYLLTVYARAA